MKRLFFSFLIVFAASPLFAQSDDYFSLGDTAFVVGTKYRSYEIEFLEGTAAFAPETEIFLNNVVKFMRFNPGVKIEIGGHIDDKTTKGLGLLRANALKQYCVDAGIDGERMITADYDSSDPIFSSVEIMTMGDKEERDAARALNQRLELKILSFEQ